MASYVPFNYEDINIAAGTYNPSPVKAFNNVTYAYWQRSLFQRATSILDFTLPEDWQGTVRDFFLYCLFRFGFVAVFDSAKFGFTFQPGNPFGRNWYYQPTHIIVSNPALKDGLRLEIGKDCEVLKLTPDFLGIWDIISYYAEKLSTLDNAINIALINSKLAYILAAKNRSCAEALKKALDKINKGEPAVVVDSKLMKSNPADTEDPWSLIDLEVKKNYILTDLLSDFQSIKNDFDSEVGIPALPYQKKERLVTDEAVMRSVDGMSRSQVWFDTLTSSMDIINSRYGNKLDVAMRYDLTAGDWEGGEDDEQQ